MIGPVVFYPGVAPARHGSRIGAALDGEGPERGRSGIYGEFEGRALDANGMLSLPLGEGRLSVSGRYGYPGLLVPVFVPEIRAAYWDYQLRFEHPLGRNERFELVVLGVFDSLELDDFDDPEEPPDIIDIFFHRAEARFVHETESLVFGVALGFGHDQSGINQLDVEVEAVRFGPRVFLEWRGDERMTLRLGAQVEGILGELRAFDGSPLPQEVDVQIDNPTFAGARARSHASAYGELVWEPTNTLELELGVRGDLFTTGSEREASAEPRLTVRYTPLAWFDVTVAAGLAYQPAVFFLPVPGLTQIALDRGLQRAIQLEAGVGAWLPPGLRVEARVFANRFDGLLLLDLFGLEDCGAGVPQGSPRACEDSPGIPRTDAWAYGSELSAKFRLFDRLTGWIAYTLTFADAENEAGVAYSPSFEVRHVGSAVVIAELFAGFKVGLRGFARSGRMDGIIARGRYEERPLPGALRLDAQVSYEFRSGAGDWRIFAEMFNVTLTRDANGLECDERGEECEIDYGPRLFYPNAGVRLTF
ncbi:MAG: TonB-dependent receptor [Myxococcota bacterium]